MKISLEQAYVRIMLAVPNIDRRQASVILQDAIEQDKVAADQRILPLSCQSFEPDDPRRLAQWLRSVDGQGLDAYLATLFKATTAARRAKPSPKKDAL